ncbi:MAG: hypothetical protein M3O09_09615 [Acidobacteriota bacterium]|nr:hypothetical protein [Acidobacteriota bacterium]
MDQAKDIAKVAAALAGDPNGDYCKFEFYQPLLQIVQDDLMNDIYANQDIARNKQAVVLANVPAGTQNFSAWFNGTNTPSISGLKQVISIREKKAGAAESSYLDMFPADDLPVSYAATGFNAKYVWTGDNILVTGANQALDMRIWGEWEPQVIVSEQSPVLPNSRICLTWGLAAAISEAHGNDQKATRFKTEYEATKSQLFRNFMLEMQKENVRQRAYGQGGGTGWF